MIVCRFDLIGGAPYCILMLPEADGIGQRRDATRATGSAAGKAGGGSQCRPQIGMRKTCHSGEKKAINPGGLGACVREDLMNLLIERNRLG